RCLGWRIGPKLGAEYGWQRQNGYAEDGGSGALRIGNVDHRFFTTALGVGLARTISANGNGKCGHISTTVTWRCQAMRNHSNPTAYKQGSTAELFPIIGYGARSSAAISLAICRHFDRHWSGNLSWSSDFAHGRRDGHASAQLCYEF
ncbi:MAG: autotransporter outer membrane beta-barrel domain-containing protein, partial [Puniceicoccales bacterium]|nr:autotransporter outer membrane beta-barrel domain-containing protein [Puniceicoccales bacterium]